MYDVVKLESWRAMEGLERCADTLTQLSIDEAILDYLLYTAIKSLLAYIQSAITGGPDSKNQQKIELPLQLVDSFLVMFRCMHPEYHASPELQFRLRLLKYATHSANRFAPSFASPTASATQALRDRHRGRAENSPYYNRIPNDLNADALAASLSPSFSRSDTTTRAKDLLGVRSATAPASSPDANSTALLDTLPEFMALSASKAMLDARNITETWMRLAAGYMSHAFMEQVLACGNSGLAPLLEAFAWGFDEFSNAVDGSDEENINVMFLGEDGTLEGWDDLREAHIRALIPPPGISLQAHLEELLANDLSSAGFEQHLHDFLSGLFNSQTEPLLVQVESGNIDGWTRSETEELKARMMMP